MPLIISMLIGALVRAVGTIVGKVLLSLGFGYVSYQGIQMALDWVKDGITQSILALPPDVISILSTLKFGQGIGVIMSAFAVRMTLDGLSSDQFRKLTQMPGQDAG